MAKYKAKYLTSETPRRRIPMRYILLAVSLLTLLSTSVLLAKYVTNSEKKENKFDTVQVSCVANETVDAANNSKTSITVTNTSTVDVYIRVRLVSYWQTPSGNIAGKTSVMPTVTLNMTDWIKSTTEADTYYYKAKVSPNGTTINLLAENAVLKLADPAKNGGYIQVVKILAEAIQADGVGADGKPAVTDAWGVILDENGNITIPATTP